MAMPWLDNSSLPVLEQVVSFTQARHGVLAGNIANLNTPGYKSRDLSPEAFQQSLREALSARQSGTSPGVAALLGETRNAGDEALQLTRLTSGTVQEGRLDTKALAGVSASMREILHHDESDISLENQIAQISKNQSTHNLAIAIMRTQYSQLRSAITENVS
ncbi:flagellar basal body rod protein FlgB [Botrimarina hoheduenensis]|uniref:Flagellar basal body rod protein FlgB n=1 Tax=Botrimarina hoheduenensis TaxID=2528000 RepID=A0A5C5VYE6_9BACT|nr:flagellar basal body protein [Botrimarina hoheduenensis]TWT43177.1 flagellar basal body rod protein FlgB [Botrimarina hoheduenensis]